ncbi:MAG: guanylate kinase [Candidatus Omnitrophica bacterium]|nr:guanylate kinase [Candidatus Omnitrophota bacterium]
MERISKPLIFIISAPSGSGKTTLVEIVLQTLDNIKESISCTTREPREGEVPDKDYIFVTKEVFEKTIEEDGFLEWEKNFGNYYGTPKDMFRNSFDAGVDVILSIDVKGAQNVKKRYPESVGVFIMPPSKEVLEKRLRGRNTDQEDQVKIRLEEAKREMACTDQYDYLIVNEDLEKAAEELATIIQNERNKKSEGS